MYPRNRRIDRRIYNRRIEDGTEQSKSLLLLLLLLCLLLCLLVRRKIFSLFSSRQRRIRVGHPKSYAQHTMELREKNSKRETFSTHVFTCARVASKASQAVILATPFTFTLAPPRSLRILLAFFCVRRFRRRRYRRFVFFLIVNKIDLQKEKRYHPRRRRRRQRADEERKKQKWEHGE